ncbi:MAG: glycosyltransferase family 2 protein [Paenibacillaceae bacterium]|nr:glycosyltransferase family 2 protein [Paenibacillaceae bacterium]
MITVSACLIVKNEENVLARCLSSLKDLADEIILVDTGSTDTTKEIGARFGCKIFDFTWVDDFAAARNFSFEKAGMDYIYTADADEVIDEENRKRFMDLKQCILPEIEIVQMKYTNQLQFNTTYNFDCEYRPKLFKRNRRFEWLDPVHETIRLEPVVFDSEIEIIHLPEGNHSKRDFDIFNKLIRKGIPLSKKLRSMYARELFISGEDQDFLKAEDYFNGLLSEDRTEEELKIIQCVLTRCGRIKKDGTQILKNALKNVACGKASSEVCYDVGEYFMEAGDMNEAVIWFYNAAYETECELNIRYSGELPLLKLAECYKQAGDMTQAKFYEELASKAVDEKGLED